MSGSLQVQEQKAALRRELRARLRQLSSETMADGSARMREALARLPLWVHARGVLCYHPLPGEPDLVLLLAASAAESEKRLFALPRFLPDEGVYAPFRVRRFPQDLVRGRFGVMEPGPDCPKLDANQLDLALVPGIGFSLSGGRLGRGEGYYDRLLAGFAGFKCGLAFDCQVLRDLPAEPHDIRLNGILTPTRWHPVMPGPSVMK